MQRDERFDTADRIIRVGLWVNSLLMLYKLGAGYWGHSAAVFADGMESACDSVTLVLTLLALKVGRKPYDEQHPYGHGRAESLAALLVSLVIMGTGVWIGVDAVQSVLRAHFQAPGISAVCAAVITIAVKEWLYRYSQATGMRLASPALLAVAKDHRKDALSSIATLFGVTGAYFGILILDPLAAGLTSLFILHIGYQTFRDAAHDLMDGSVDEEFITAVSALAEGVPKVEHVHEIRARRSGQYVIVDLKLDMDPGMTVKESHDVATEVKRTIFNRYATVGDVMIHINPHDEEHEDLIRL